MTKTAGGGATRGKVEQMTSLRRNQGRRWTKVAVAAVAVVGLAASATACGGGDSAPEESITIEATETGPSAAELIARASDTTSQVESGRMRMTMNVDFDAMGESGSSEIVADGAFADFGRQSEMNMDMGSYLRDLAGSEASEVPDSLTLRMVLDDTLMYMKFDAIPAEPGMEYWYVQDLEAEAEDLGLDSSMFDQQTVFGVGPSGYIEQLKGAGADVQESGSDTIDGVPVTRYEGTIDPLVALEKADPDKRDELERALEQTGMGEPMPFTAWVDDEGIVRRISQELSADMDGVSMHIVQVIDLYDFGAPVTITMPPADLVRDMSELSAMGSATA
jgi:hypothetical protein